MICRGESGEGVLQYIEVGEQDEPWRCGEIHDCSRWAMTNEGKRLLGRSKTLNSREYYRPW